MDNITAAIQSKPSLLGGNTLTYVGMARVGMPIRPEETCAVFVLGPDGQVYELRFFVREYAGQSFGVFCLCGHDFIWKRLGYAETVLPVYPAPDVLHVLGFTAMSNPDQTWTIAALPSLG